MATFHMSKNFKEILNQLLNETYILGHGPSGSGGWDSVSERK